MNIKEIEEKINNFILNMDYHDKYVFDNIEFFYQLNFIVTKFLENSFKNYEKCIDISKMDKISFYEIIDLLNKFYKELNINFDVSKLYNDGTIGYKFFEYDDEDNYERFRIGANYYNVLDNKKSIIVCNNGIITDADILVHELSHFRNDMTGGRSLVTMLFTETLALTDELIFYDFLIKKNYKIDHNFIKSSFNFFYENSLNLIPIMELLLLYREVGSISKKSFEDYYETSEDYEEDLEILNDMPNDASLINAVSYTLSSLIAPYLFYKYKNEKSYIFLNELNSMIMNESSDSDKCFRKIGLNGLDENDVKILSKNIKIFKKEYLK